MTIRRARLAVAVVFALTALTVTGAAGAADALAKWRAGTDYQVLPEPVAPTVADGKVEVAEVFWYGCGHCYALDPVLEEWNKSKASFIEFVRVPVIWGPPHRQHAKLFYTVQALRRPELHAKIFQAIHREGLHLADRDETVARKMHFEFLSRHDVSEQQFNAAYDSMMVATNLQRARTLTLALHVDSVPTVFVNGKYSAMVPAGGGERQLIALINDLAESEKR